MACALFALALAGCRSNPPTKLATGLWLATPGDFASEPAPLLVYHIDSGFTREVGPPAQYRGVAWAPSGRYLSAVRVDGEAAAVVVFDLDEDDTAYEWPLQTPETLLTWSPDSLRLFALSAAEGFMLNVEAEPVGLLSQPLEPLYPQSLAPSIWSPDGAYAATIYHGYLLLVDRGGSNFYVDPALLPPILDPAGLTVFAWDAADVVAVFDESNPESPRRYSLRLDGAELEFVATTNLPAGTGPYSHPWELAERVAPGATAALGVSAMPHGERWFAIEPEGSAPSAIYHLAAGSLLRIADPTFAGVPAHVLAANVGVVRLPPIAER